MAYTLYSEVLDHTHRYQWKKLLSRHKIHTLDRRSGSCGRREKDTLTLTVYKLTIHRRQLNAIECTSNITWLRKLYTQHYNFNFNYVSNIWMQLIHPLSIRLNKKTEPCMITLTNTFAHMPFTMVNGMVFFECWFLFVFVVVVCTPKYILGPCMPHTNLLTHDVLNYCLVKWRPPFQFYARTHFFHCRKFRINFDKACKRTKKTSESAVIYDLNCGSLVLLEFT